MKEIDFSPKHNVLIRHKDGTLTPMDVPYYEVTELNEDTWQIMSSGDYHYLIVGEDSGIAIDTGYGAGNLREFLEGLCGKTVPWVVNTHHHFDHTANNFYFDRAFMAEEAFPVVSVPYPSFQGIKFPEPDYLKTAVGDDDVIPLKGRGLQVFRIGDHTKDGIAVLDRKRRILFTGDEIMPGMKNINGSVERWKNHLEKLLAHRDEFDRIYGGAGELEDGILEIFYEAACMILEGKRSEVKITETEQKILHEERDECGRLIYDCQIPHPEDKPKNVFLKENPNMVVFVYKGYKFIYDKTLIRE